MRKAGILMPVASLPDRHGCGTFGKNAYNFIDSMKKAGLSIWQILPLNPLGYGNSPYQPYSSYAMDDLYISLDRLKEEGLIQRDIPSFHKNSNKIDYEAVRKYREPFLKEAYRNFKPDLNYTNFSFQDWVKDYSLFMTFKKTNDKRCWLEWEDTEQKDYPYLNKKMNLKEYEDEILYQIFLQYELFLQWKELKQYANDRDIEIMGDIPFYVGIDSADVWANRENFLLDKDGHPTFIAGVPPDYFSATGQRWGNPIYNWDYLEKNKFAFWIERLSYSGKMFDLVRVDHFRAFDTYWKIPASCPTAMDGEWVEAPGYKLFDALFEQNPDLQIIAEDLGDLRAQVLELRDHYAFRGMRVIQFSFNPEEMGEKDKPHLLVYTGTHDNDTIFSWYRSKPRKEQREMRQCLKKLGYSSHSFVDDVIAYSLNSDADMVIIPIFDWLHLSHNARLNTPGTVGAPNWMWRLADFNKFHSQLPDIKKVLMKTKRTARL